MPSPFLIIMPNINTTDEWLANQIKTIKQNQPIFVYLDYKERAIESEMQSLGIAYNKSTVLTTTMKYGKKIQIKDYVTYERI